VVELELANNLFGKKVEQKNLFSKKRFNKKANFSAKSLCYFDSVRSCPDVNWLGSCVTPFGKGVQIASDPGSIPGGRITKKIRFSFKVKFIKKEKPLVKQNERK